MVLIDTWWNVNAISIGGHTYILNVLIDTWWNVNNGVRIDTACRVGVLIDTWWNVNAGACFINKKMQTCFNRYMVECELRSGSTSLLLRYRFNRYMVECE